MNLAIRLATDCGRTYAGAGDKVRRVFNSTVFSRLMVTSGQITHVEYRAPFDLIFSGRWPAAEADAAVVGPSSNNGTWLGREDSNL